MAPHWTVGFMFLYFISKRPVAQRSCYPRLFVFCVDWSKNWDFRYFPEFQTWRGYYDVFDEVHQFGSKRLEKSHIRTGILSPTQQKIYASVYLLPRYRWKTYLHVTKIRHKRHKLRHNTLIFCRQRVSKYDTSVVSILITYYARMLPLQHGIIWPPPPP